MHHNVIALDLAKNVIQMASLSKHGVLKTNKAMSPDKIRATLANTAPCVVAMEGCGSAHYWGRFAQECGHQVRMMSPKKVKAFVPGQKTDANDALGIAIASKQPSMTFSAPKTVEQQSLKLINTSRKHLDKLRTASNNHIRAIAYEFGQTIPRGQKGLRTRLAELLSADHPALPDSIKASLSIMWEHYQHTDQQLTVLNKQLDTLTKQSEPCQRLQALEGIGPKSSSLLVATLGDGSDFKNGREAAVRVGVTPKQHSSGGKTVLLGITKHGDATLRATLYQGALSVISQLKPEATTTKHQWLLDLVRRVGIKRACIALVNKNIRTAWAMLRYNTEYQPVYL